MARFAPLATRAAGGLLIAAGIGGVTDAAAQSRWQYSVSVPMEIEYDSNPGLAVGREEGTTFLRVVPAGTVRYVHDNDEYQVEGALSAEKSSNQSAAKDRLDPRMRAAWKHLSERTTTELAVILDRRALRNVDVREQVPLNVDGSRTLFAVTGNWQHDLDARTALAADLRQEWERFSDNRTPDFRRTTAALRMTRAHDERRSWYAAGNAQYYQPEDTPGTLAGTGGGDSRVIGVVLGIEQALSEALKVDASVGPVYFDQASSSRLGWQGAAKAEYTGERWFGALELARAPGVNATFAGLVITNELRMRLRWDLDALARLEFDAGHAREASTGSRRTRVGLAWIRQWTAAWQFVVRASTNRQEGLEGSARSNRISFGLVYTAPDL